MTRRGGRAALRAIARMILVAAAGCVSPPPPALLRVDVWQGGTAVPRPAPPGRVHLVLDVTESMGAGRPGDAVPPAEAARAAAQELLRVLPADTTIVLHALGIAVGRACTPAVRSETPPEPSARERLAATVGRLDPRSESSLSEALAGVREELRREDPPGAGRVVVVSDLRDDCGGDVCEALSALVQDGATVDLVALGGSPPACAEALSPGSLPPGAEDLVPPPPPRFHVEHTNPDTGAPVAVLTGRAGDAPAPLPAGAATVVVETDPPLRIGPLALVAGRTHVVRVVRFPGREVAWSAWTAEPTGSGGAP